jgi:hypothetical protein
MSGAVLSGLAADTIGVSATNAGRIALLCAIRAAASAIFAA